MAHIPTAEQEAAVFRARRNLQGYPIRQSHIEQVAGEVLKAQPTATGEELVGLITETAFRQWCAGLDCC